MYFNWLAILKRIAHPR